MTNIESLAVKLWDKRLNPYPADALDGVDVTPATRVFLLNTGMPRISDVFPDWENVTLYTRTEKTQIAGESLLQIGEDFGTAIRNQACSLSSVSSDTVGALQVRQF